MTEEFIYRVHPAIGMARVGNSEQFYLAPETIAGIPTPAENGKQTGGLPIRPGTESETITSSELRDDQKKLLRQAARFKIYQYSAADKDKYPCGAGTEITIGSTVDGQRKVVDMVWTVHLANKKANHYVLENDRLGSYDKFIDGYANGGLPPLRNAQEGSDPNSFDRLRRLVIDPGPRAIRGSSDSVVSFSKESQASFGRNAEISCLPDYPKTFPNDQQNLSPELYAPSGDIKTLGELRTDNQGRLLVVGGYGRACSWYPTDEAGNYQGAAPYPLNGDVDNDGWFDDTADGPVSVTLVLDDGSTQDVHGAWAVSTDPAFAPQILNVVTLWDDIYNAWVREPELAIAPNMFANGRYNDHYQPSFEDEINPFIQAATLQAWIANLPERAYHAHKEVGTIKADDDPDKTIMAGLKYIRNPNEPMQAGIGSPLMPYHLGDQGQAFLSPTFTQYFFLQQWDAKKYIPHGPSEATKLGPGEYLDKAVLMNCLGGRFSPGIDMTFIVRQPQLYQTDWRETGSGPFRINAKKIDYSQYLGKEKCNVPVLSEGYVPLHHNQDGLEPGDTSKFMALPWHTDYNSCATHTTSPNPSSTLIQQPRSTLYWSWPAQRPTAVYTAKDVYDNQGSLTTNSSETDLLPSRYSLRGPGTEATDPKHQGRYQNRLDIITHWHQIGTVLQGSAIDSEDNGPFNEDYYLEVSSLLPPEPSGSEAPPWPLNATKAT